MELSLVASFFLWCLWLWGICDSVVLRSRGAGFLVPKAKSLSLSFLFFSLCVFVFDKMRNEYERERERCRWTWELGFVCVGSCAREKVGCTSFSRIPTFARDWGKMGKISYAFPSSLLSFCIIVCSWFPSWTFKASEIEVSFFLSFL